MTWRIALRGGAYDEWTGSTDAELCPILIAWKCGPFCDGHASFDPHDPEIVLKTAESYRRTEVDIDERLAVYEVGAVDPAGEVEERAVVGAGDGIAYG